MPPGADERARCPMIKRGSVWALVFRGALHLPYWNEFRLEEIQSNRMLTPIPIPIDFLSCAVPSIISPFLGNRDQKPNACSTKYRTSKGITPLVSIVPLLSFAFQFSQSHFSTLFAPSPRNPSPSRSPLSQWGQVRFCFRMEIRVAFPFARPTPHSHSDTLICIGR